MRSVIVVFVLHTKLDFICRYIVLIIVIIVCCVCVCFFFFFFDHIIILVISLHFLIFIQIQQSIFSCRPVEMTKLKLEERIEKLIQFAFKNSNPYKVTISFRLRGVGIRVAAAWLPLQSGKSCLRKIHTQERF